MRISILFSERQFSYNLYCEEIIIKIEFIEEDIQALTYERYHYPHPRVQRKMEAL